MIKKLLKYICCPYDKSEDWQIIYRDQVNNDVAAIICKSCNRRYPVIGSILSIMPDSFWTSTSLTAELKRMEQKVRDEQAEVYLKWFGPYTQNIEYEHILKELQISIDELLLDVGCGIGRMTIHISSHCREIVAIDYSLKSLQLLKDKLEQNEIGNVLLLQTDATLLPFKNSIFNKALSSQVFTFIPSRDFRDAAFKEIYRVLKSKSKIVLTVFNNHIFRKYKLFKGIPGVFKKEGTHPDLKFYYYNYNRFELKKQLKKLGFRHVKSYGICNFPREKVVYFSEIDGIKEIIYIIDKYLSYTYLSCILGDLLIASAEKR